MTTSLNTSETSTKIERLHDLYDSGASLGTMLAELGYDDDTLRLIHSRIGTAMSTLRREVAYWQARS